MPDLYAILKSTEKLERAYVRDAISARDYEPACQRLIAHYRTLWSTVSESVPSLQSFMATYGMQCPMAARRLAQSGMPATVEHGRATSSGEAGYTAAVADAVGQFITTMDALKLNMAAVDQVFPLLSDLTQSLNKVGKGMGGQCGRLCLWGGEEFAHRKSSGSLLRHGKERCIPLGWQTWRPVAGFRKQCCCFNNQGCSCGQALPPRANVKGEGHAVDRPPHS